MSSVRATHTLGVLPAAAPSPTAKYAAKRTGFTLLLGCVLLLILVVLPQTAHATTFAWVKGSVPVVADGDTVTMNSNAAADGPSGTLNVPAGAAVTIEGVVTGTTSGITLNVSPTSTVIWNATMQGARPGAKVVTLTGGGTLNVTSGIIVNVGSTSASGALAVMGDGCRVIVGHAGIVASDTAGTGILVNANNVTVSVVNGGAVQSLKTDPNSSSSGSALQIGSNYSGVVVGINGGSVIADFGYAINDGAGTGTVSNNTVIAIDGTALVQAGTPCAIHSTGSSSIVVVNDGIVTNAASSNANPTIYMNAGSGLNITINGGTVQNTNTANTAYALQTTGNILVSGGTVTTTNGRSVNLTGTTSNITVNGGVVQTTGTNGTAICTATTTGNVDDTSININGGTVASVSTSNPTIQISGANTTVTMTGGTVTATSAEAITDRSTTATNAAIDIKGGSVVSQSGRAIYIVGANASVIIGGGDGTVDPPIMGAQVTSTSTYAIQMNASTARVTITENCQVYSLYAGAAIYQPNATPASNYVQDGGFVFAFGIDASKVVNPARSSVGGGLLVAWNQASGNTVYPQLVSPPASPEVPSHSDLSIVTKNHSYASTTSYTDYDSYFGWSSDPQHGGGIWYYEPDFQTAKGMFFLSAVRAVRGTGLIYDCGTGNMYIDLDGDGTISSGDTLYNDDKGNLWNASLSNGVYNLILNGFGWQTSAPVALRIVNSTATSASITVQLNPNKNNVFISTDAADDLAPQPLYAGLYVDTTAGNLNVYGGGVLVARAGGPAGCASYGIAGNGSYSMQSGDVTAGGNSSAYHFPSSTSVSGAYNYWDTTAIAENGGHNGIFTPDGTCMHSCHSGNGTLFLASSAPTNNVAYSIASHMDSVATGDNIDRYVRIESQHAAYVNNVTIGGIMEQILPAQANSNPQRAIITPIGYSISSTINGVDATSWFSYIPDGITVTAQASPMGSGMIYLDFAGTPKEGFTGPFSLTIPGTYLSGGADAAVYANPKAIFDIKPVYYYLVSTTAGGSLDPSGHLSAQYLPGTALKTTAIPDPGYRFKQWETLDSILPVAPSFATEPTGGLTPLSTGTQKGEGTLTPQTTITANPLMMTMPGNRIIVTGQFEKIPTPVTPKPKTPAAPISPTKPKPSTAKTPASNNSGTGTNTSNTGNRSQGTSTMPNTGDTFTLLGPLALLATTISSCAAYSARKRFVEKVSRLPKIE